MLNSKKKGWYKIYLENYNVQKFNYNINDYKYKIKIVKPNKVYFIPKLNTKKYIEEFILENKIPFEMLLNFRAFKSQNGDEYFNIIDYKDIFL
jgi:hypothetical protein